jgi:Domain of unknown function (DUF4249)
MKHFYKLLLGGSILVLVSACIDPVNQKYEFNSNLVRIDGLLTEQEPFFVTVVQSKSQQGTEFSQPIKGATAELIVSDGSRVVLRESGVAQGRYEAPTTFRGRAGVAYRLRVRFTDGRVYESSLERLVAAPPITNTHIDFNREGIKDSKGFVVASSLDVSIDAPDNGQETNFYQWRTFLYEKQAVCGSCTNGEWEPSYNDCSYYRSDPPIRPPIINDYECDRPCWEIFLDSRLNIFSDALTNGSPISKRLVRQVPFYQENQGALLQIQQLSISPVIYRYFNLIKQQSETTGTLTDVAPSPPVGNIRNVNKADEPVLGYFAAVGMSRTTLWLDRSTFQNRKTTTMLPGGRQRVFDANDPFTKLPKPYRVSCTASPNRFLAPPAGWRF